MSARPIAYVRIRTLVHGSPGAVRVEVGCRYETTGLTQMPGPMLALTREQMVTAAVYAHEERCGLCDTEPAHGKGDRRVRAMTERAWDELLAAAQRRYAASVRN